MFQNTLKCDVKHVVMYFKSWIQSGTIYLRKDLYLGLILHNLNIICQRFHNENTLNPSE